MSYSVIKKQDIEQAAGTVEKDVKKSVLLASGWDKKYAVAALVLDNVMPKVEVHENDTDVFRVVSGSGAFVLGGTATNLEKTGDGEWVGDAIEGGERVDVSEGDMLDIPPGVPHQFDVRGKRLELVIVKIRKAK